MHVACTTRRTDCGTRRLACSASQQAPAPGGQGDDARQARALFEARNPAWLARVAALGSVGVVAAAGLPGTLADALRGADPDATALLAANAALVAGCGLSVRSDLRRRARDSARFATELRVGAMPLRRFDRYGNEKAACVADLKAGSARCVLLYGKEADLIEDVGRAAVYARRLAASKLYVVPVASDAGAGGASALASSWAGASFVLLPSSPARFAAWFEELVGGGADGGRGDGGARGRVASAYVTLDQNGRVRGSGLGRPRFDSLLASFPQNRIGAMGIGEADVGEGGRGGGGGGAEGREYRLTGAAATAASAVAESDLAEGDERRAVAEASRRFYAALAAGDGAAMAGEWANAAESAFVTGAVMRDARLDGWDVVLREDRRPLGMDVGDFDVTVRGDVAYLTLLETVANGSTLLATQRFSRGADGAWQIEEHRTIPYGKDIVAKVVLRCDCRGCVAVPAKAAASWAEPRDGDEAGRLLARD